MFQCIFLEHISGFINNQLSLFFFFLTKCYKLHQNVLPLKQLSLSANPNGYYGIIGILLGVELYIFMLTVLFHLEIHQLLEVT